MSVRRIGRQVREAWEVPRDILLGRYPEFVTGGPLPRGDVPVFVFHSLEPESFGRKLRHLATNGYATLSADEYFRVLMGAGQAPERAVLLTFDDGRGSVWTVGAPLLQRFGMKGLVFLVPGRMRSRRGPPEPTWADVEGGQARPEAVLTREEGEGALLYWEEVEELSRTGLLDFESHTLFHARIHTSPHVTGFVTPGARRGYVAFDLPLHRVGDRDLTGQEVPLGAPVLRSQPRTSEALRFYEEPDLGRDCVRTVEENGGEAFFSREDWEQTLRRLARRRGIGGRLETPEEREAAIRTELAESKRLIEERTGRPVHHLCYPWHTAGPTARRLAQEAGYRTAFCGKVPGTRLTRPGGDPNAVARIGEDYLELLPGRGRADLKTVLRRKWSRRVRKGPP